MIRRDFVIKSIQAVIALIFSKNAFAEKIKRKGMIEEKSAVFRSVNGTPEENMHKVIELAGGIEKYIGKDDVVVIKPNVQWWNQGTPNLSALKTFVELIMERPGGFDGEVVIAENNHRGSQPWNHAGWAHIYERNSDIPAVANFNELTTLLKKKYGQNYSTRHWIDVDEGGQRVYSPADGTGYVYCDGTNGVPLISVNNGAAGDDYRATIMTYPIFKTDRDTIVDLKNGIWQNGSYTDRPLRFINFAALNHHSSYFGFTSSVKNYLGVSDLSGGHDPKNGWLTEGYNNFHAFPFNGWNEGPVAGMIGREVACYLNTIRKADLNITTAEWVGLADRMEPPVIRARAVLASVDPVALDYHAAKYILYPNSKIPFHNPDEAKSPAFQYLDECSKHHAGFSDEQFVAINSYDFKQGRLQTDDELTIRIDKKWGTNPKGLLKYIIYRFL